MLARLSLRCGASGPHQTREKGQKDAHRCSSTRIHRTDQRSCGYDQGGPCAAMRRRATFSASATSSGRTRSRKSLRLRLRWRVAISLPVPSLSSVSGVVGDPLAPLSAPRPSREECTSSLPLGKEDVKTLRRLPAPGTDGAQGLAGGIWRGRNTGERAKSQIHLSPPQTQTVLAQMGDKARVKYSPVKLATVATRQAIATRKAS